MTTLATNRTVPLNCSGTLNSSAPVVACDRRGGPVRAVILLTLGLATLRCFAADSATETLHFLEQRVTSDPLDSVALNRLATACVTQMRETGNLVWLDRAAQAAHASLAAVPAAQNPSGLAAMALAEFEFHHFREALALAQRAHALTRATPPRSPSPAIHNSSWATTLRPKPSTKSLPPTKQRRPCERGWRTWQN